MQSYYTEAPRGVKCSAVNISIWTRIAVIGWVSVSVGRVQEGRKLAEYATLARIAAANDGYVIQRSRAVGPLPMGGTARSWMCHGCLYDDRLMRAQRR